MKAFLLRLGFFIPIALFAVYVLLIVFGYIANALGATDVFYCSVFCKIALSVVIAAIASVVYCQAKDCWKVRHHNPEF